MVIEKVLNNNVVVTRDAAGREVVAMGRGIAFKKRAGETFDVTAVEKIFRMEEEGLAQKFESLLAGIPAEYLSVSAKIIELSEKELGAPLSEALYIGLTDHIHAAVERLRGGIRLRNKMLWELRRFYPKEFALGRKGAALVAGEFSIDIPEDEAGFIAMHIIGGALPAGERADAAEGVVCLVDELVAIVRRALAISMDEESLAYFRFVTHLKFFAQRVLTGSRSEDELDTEMEAMVQKKYARSYRVACQMADFVWSRYACTVTRDEKFYLTVHLAKLLRQSKERGAEKEP